MTKPELLSPAGNREKLETAILFGADAVYLSGNRFGMRAAADNFDTEGILNAVKYAHERKKKVHLTLNTMPREDEYPALCEYIDSLHNSALDAFIIADPGVLERAKELAPEIPVHISTQASVVSSAACEAYLRAGASRVVLARELSLDEIKKIRKNTSKELELEVFVHGSMCISYSGRCLLSGNMTGRDANRGECAQPCRWEYRLFEIEEKTREGERFPLIQTERGSFIMSSRDLCMIKRIPELCEAGISSFKIEGRMKSAYYAAVCTNAYRMAIDSFISDPENYKFDDRLFSELESVSHREYAEGCFFSSPMSDPKLVTEGGYIRDKAYLATALGGGLFVQRNKMTAGQTVEVISPGCFGKSFTVNEIFDENGERIDSTPHAGMLFRLNAPFEIKKGDIIRGKA